MPLITLQNVDYSVGGPLLLEKAELSIESGERIALIGRNGAGKSTLMKLMAGELKPDDGEVRVQQGVRVTRLEQEVPHGASGSVFDVVADGLGELGHWLAEFHRLSHAETFDGDAMGKVQARIDAADGWALDQRVSETLTKLELDGDAEFGRLSGGMKRRVLLARALVAGPDVLLLDEPTNHLDLVTREALAMALNSFDGTVMLVSHDRALLRAVCDDFWLVGEGTIRPFDGDLDDYQRYLLDVARQKREALADAASAQRQQATPDKPALSGAEQRKLQAAQRQQYLEARRPLVKRQQQLEQGMDKLQADKTRLEAELCQPLEPAAIAEAGRQLKQTIDALEAAELEWLDVSAELETLESNAQQGS